MTLKSHKATNKNPAYGGKKMLVRIYYGTNYAPQLAEKIIKDSLTNHRGIFHLFFGTPEPSDMTGPIKETLPERFIMHKPIPIFGCPEMHDWIKNDIIKSGITLGPNCLTDLQAHPYAHELLGRLLRDQFQRILDETWPHKQAILVVTDTMYCFLLDALLTKLDIKFVDCSAPMSYIDLHIDNSSRTIVQATEYSRAPGSI